MSNELINKNMLTPSFPSITGGTNLNIFDGGDDNTYNFIVNPTNIASYPSPINVDNRLYNLIVVNVAELSTMSFILPANLVLTKCISAELKRQHANLSERAIELIKSYPSIVLSTNDKPNFEKQKGYLGYVLSVDKYSSNILIRFNPKFEIKQSLINALSSELNLVCTPEINELDKVHWTIKQVDIVETLENAGVKFPRM